MLKDKQLTECSREKWVNAQKKDAEQKHKFKKAIHPQRKDKLH